MRSRVSRAISVGVVCVATIFSTSHLLARHYGASTPWPKKKTPAKTTQPTTQSTNLSDGPTTAPVVDDTTGKAQASLLAAEARAKRKFESSQEWLTAQSTVSKALADVQTANQSIATSVRAQPEYKTAAEQVTQADAALQHARESGADSSQIATDASALMNARSALGGFQNRAASSDPVLIAAKEKLATANLAVEQLHRREIAFVLADPDWQAAKKAYDDARAKVVTLAR